MSQTSYPLRVEADFLEDLRLMLSGYLASDGFTTETLLRYFLQIQCRRIERCVRRVEWAMDLRARETQRRAPKPFWPGGGARGSHPWHPCTRRTHAAGPAAPARRTAQFRNMCLFRVSRFRCHPTNDSYELIRRDT